MRVVIITGVLCYASNSSLIYLFVGPLSLNRCFLVMIGRRLGRRFVDRVVVVASTEGATGERRQLVRHGVRVVVERWTSAHLYA